ncbi:MAG: acetyl-CoA carboxylase, carboxyltransferase subunit beta, partial [Candidatus Margulisiibacteriota bacterium]
ERLDVPGNLWVKCYKCNAAIFSKDLKENYKICPKCGYHFKLSAKERIEMTLDENSFKEFDQYIRSKDFLDFTDSKPYAKRLTEAIAKSGLNDAVITGEGTIEKMPVKMGIMDFSFMGGSMGSVVGEKITRMIEHAVESKQPVIIFSTSGGARMQEGIMSLMQMAKTSEALGRLRLNGIPYISIITDPTTGGTSASYAMLGDINIAEPGALICFAGPRVIEQTIRQKLPPGFQRSEYLKDHGMVDIVCSRNELKATLVKLLKFFSN